MSVAQKKQEPLFPEDFDLEQWRADVKVGDGFQPPLPKGRRLYENFMRLVRRMRWFRFIEFVFYSLTSRERMTFREQSVFQDLDVGAAVTALKKDGYYAKFHLPAKEHQEILEFVRTTRSQGGFADPYQARLRYIYDRVSEVEKLIGAPIAISNYEYPASRCAAIDRIVHDAKLAELVKAYTGFFPLTHRTLLWWSHVTTISEEERLAGAQTISYHVDEVDSDLGEGEITGAFFCSSVFISRTLIPGPALMCS